MGVYVKGNPKEGEYKLIKTTDGFVLDGKDIAYACIEIDETNTELLEFYNEFKKRKASKEVAKYINAVYGERRAE